MNIKNKLELQETIENDYVICAENENTVVAEIMEAISELPEDADRAKRIVQCYNFFVGIEDPEAFFNSIYEKAKKWDILDDKIAKCYVDDNGDELSEEAAEGIDLGTIGEIAASSFGWL